MGPGPKVSSKAMPTNSKELVRALFASKPVSRPPFIPYMAAAAAQFMQVPVRQMYSDPTTLANSLQSCQRLFKYDGVVILFDTTLEAEACGCQLSWQEELPPKVVSSALTSDEDLDALDVSGIENRGRIPVVLEAARRLTQTMGREVAMLGVITGPMTLGRHLAGDAFVSTAETNTQAFQKLVDLSGEIALTMARAYGELKFDAVILADADLASLKPDHYPKIQPMLKTLRNLLHFYDTPLIIHTGKVHVERLHDFLQLEADGFSLANHISDIARLRSSSARLFGRCIHTSSLLGSTEDVEKATLELFDTGDSSSFFITTEGEVPQTTPAVNLHKVMQVLTSAPKR